MFTKFFDTKFHPPASLLSLLIAGVVLFTLPVYIPSFYVGIVNEMLIMALFAMAVNLLLGYGGMISFGHACYFGIGAYVPALLIKWTHIPLNLLFPIAFIGAPIVASLFGLLFGYFCVRLRALYFAMLSLAFGQIVWAALFKLYSFSGGESGITAINPPEFLVSSSAFYYFSLIVVAACALALYRIVNSPFGWAIRAIRENATRAEFVSIPVWKYRLQVFVISTFFSGIAGFLFAFLQRYANPSYAGFLKSGEPIIASLVGGMHSFLGPAIGSAIMVLLNYTTSKFTEYWLITLGIILLLVVLFFPSGITGYISRKIQLKRGKNE